jgi:putative transposase
VARFPRVVAVDVAHRVVQRGNGRTFVLGSDADRRVYLTLLREYIEFHDLQLLGYCLMSNHVHLAE